jgi:hypothetical protein
MLRCDHSNLMESHWYKALFLTGNCMDMRFPLESCKCGENMSLELWEHMF